MDVREAALFESLAARLAAAIVLRFGGGHAETSADFRALLALVRQWLGRVVASGLTGRGPLYWGLGVRSRMVQ